MSVTWSNELELTLLEFYQAEPILWQAKNSDHKNKSKVHDAWKRISESMNISIPEIKKKKDSLLSSYRAYRKKVRDSIHSGAGAGEIYKPLWFAYELIDSFLGESNNCNKTMDTRGSPIPSLAEENLSAPMPVPPPTIRRRKNPPEVTEAENVVKDALTTLKATFSVRQINEEDECDLHGKVIAKKLRQIPENERTQFVCEIYNLFVQRDKSLQSPYYSPSPIPPPCSTVTYSSYEPPMYFSSSSLPEVIIPEENSTPKINITSNRVIYSATENSNHGDNAIDGDFKDE